MAMYTFYPCRADGRPITFEAFELPDDATARRHAETVLRRHETCTDVEIWREGQLVAVGELVAE